jgi:hypothetical protein
MDSQVGGITLWSYVTQWPESSKPLVNSRVSCPTRRYPPRSVPLAKALSVEQAVPWTPQKGNKEMTEPQELLGWNDPDDLLKALGQIGHGDKERLVAAVAPLALHEDPDVREEAIRVLLVRWKDALYRDRAIERLCIEVQARFLRQTPGIGVTMAEEAEAALSHPWWTAESQRASSEQLLEQHNIPRWLRSVMPS